MAKIYNSELTKGMAKHARIQQNIDKIPNELAEKVVPVMETNPEILRENSIIASGAAINNTSGLVYTSSTTMETYITGYQISFIKDAGSTCSVIRAYLTPEATNASIAFARISCLTGTAQSGEVSYTFKNPVKLVKGTSITINPDTNAANCTASLCVYGYTIDNPNS